MTRAFDINDNSKQNPKRPPQARTGDALKKRKVEGKALKVNENSVENSRPTPVPPKRG